MGKLIAHLIQATIMAALIGGPLAIYLWRITP
jgi:hypothetical protein